jgi:hypothetical protein
MKYKHHSLLPIGAFKRRGSVVGGRLISLHGGDSWYAEEDPDDSFRRRYEYALQMAAKGYPKILNDLKASGEIEQFQAKEAEKTAINQAAAKIAESRKPFDLALFAGSDYARAAELANWHLSRGDPQGYAQQFIDQAAQGLAQIQAENKKQADLQAQYGNLRFGTGFGQALGYSYGLKNAYGDIYQKYDAQGNLTEYLDKNGKWVDTSTIKPTGFEGFDESGKPIVGYQHPEYGTYFNNSNKYAPMMSPYKEDQGGFLGEGGWKNIGMLVATGLTAGLSAAGGAGSLLGTTAGAANLAESAAAMTALLEGGSTLGTALQIGNQLVNIGTTAHQFLKDTNPEAAAVIQQLQTEVAKNESSGMSRDAAVESALGSVSETPAAQQLAEAIRANPSMFNYQETDPVAVPLIQQLQTEVARNEAAGMSRDQATQKAITDLSVKSDVYRKELAGLILSGDQQLMDALGQTQESLIDVITGVGSGISTEIQNTRTTLLDQIARNEAAGMSRDVALNTAIRDVSTKLGVTEQNLLGAIGQTKAELSGQIAGVGQQVTDLTGQFGQYKTEQEKRQEEEQREKRGKEAVNLLSQMATTTVKTPEVAKIDYMYDIGGDSLFATPKQESLMPSPFEETPEAAEGAMPKYQYYAPGGGYTYADGGLIGTDDLQTVDDLYEMLRSK